MFDHTPYPDAPAELLDSLDRYAVHGVPTGGMLRAVLANDLGRAVHSMYPPIARLEVLKARVRPLIPMADQGGPVCRICGCTDFHGCAGGCSWVYHSVVRGDVCSRCVALIERTRQTEVTP